MAGSKTTKACCLVSQMLEEMGLDSRKARELRRQALVGGITFLQWQLARLEDDRAADAPRPAAGGAPRRGRRVRVAD